jgi:ABC-type transporter Mla subunit MlaD
MAPSPCPAPFDQAAEANALANRFYELSDAVDDFRLAPRDPRLDDLRAGRLKDEAQALENRAHYFTAKAIGATLDAIQAELGDIKTLTKQVKQQVEALDDVDKVINIVTSALSLGTAIAAGDPGSIASAVKALAGASGLDGHAVDASDA